MDGCSAAARMETGAARFRRRARGHANGVALQGGTNASAMPLLVGSPASQQGTSPTSPAKRRSPGEEQLPFSVSTRCQRASG